MLKDVTLGQFFPGSSIVHRLDPRCKLLLTIVYIAALFTAKSYVSYAVMLIFNPGTRDEIDWKTVDVAAQFRKHCAPICANISSRISLLIAEITSASGQPPVIISIAPGHAPQQH